MRGDVEWRGGEIGDQPVERRRVIDVGPGGDEMGAQAEGGAALKRHGGDVARAPDHVAEERGMEAAGGEEVVAAVVAGAERDVGVVERAQRLAEYRGGQRGRIRAEDGDSVVDA